MSNFADLFKKRGQGGDAELLDTKDVERAFAWVAEKLKDPFVLTTAVYIGDAQALIPEGEETTLQFDQLIKMVKSGEGKVHLAVASRVNMLGLDATYYEARTNEAVVPHLDELRAVHNELASDLREKYLQMVTLLNGLFRMIPGFVI